MGRLKGKTQPEGAEQVAPACRNTELGMRARGEGDTQLGITGKSSTCDYARNA